MNLFCVRPQRFNVGNETIDLATRLVVRETLPPPLNLIGMPATVSEEHGSLSGITPHTAYEMNQYGQGVIIGGGNLYENGQLDVDLEALRGLEPPLLLFSLSHGRVYNTRRRLVRRTDSLSDQVIRALSEKATASLVRDVATLEYLRDRGIENVRLVGCPTMLLSELYPEATKATDPTGSVLISIRNPSLMSIPVEERPKIYSLIERIIRSVQADSGRRVKLLCHDRRDVAFAASFPEAEYMLADDALAHLAVLRNADAVISFRLHATLPCLSFGTHCVNISYDERSESLMRTIGMGEWDIPYFGEGDIAESVLRKLDAVDELKAARAQSKPVWDELAHSLRSALKEFSDAVLAYA